MDELKPCPFCGSSEDLLRDFNWGYFYILCMVCESEGPPKGSVKEAEQAWNTRA